jgi:hypothetical protein
MESAYAARTGPGMTVRPMQASVATCAKAAQDQKRLTASTVLPTPIETRMVSVSVMTGGQGSSVQSDRIRATPAVRPAQVPMQISVRPAQLALR